MDTEIENIDELVDDILKSSTYEHRCVKCGAKFVGKTKGAKYCPACLREIQRAAGRKRAANRREKAAAQPAPRPEEATQGMTRAQILDAAKACVCGQREQDYGSPEDSFQLIADLWSDYIIGSCKYRGRLTPVDVAAMMSLMKIARIGGGRGTLDSFVDLAGYAACGGEIATGGGNGEN